MTVCALFNFVVDCEWKESRRCHREYSRAASLHLGFPEYGFLRGLAGDSAFEVFAYFC